MYNIHVYRHTCNIHTYIHVASIRIQQINNNVVIGNKNFQCMRKEIEIQNKVKQKPYNPRSEINRKLLVILDVQS